MSNPHKDSTKSAPSVSESVRRSKRKIRLSWRKKVVFSLLTTVAYFVLVELTLALFGVQPALEDHDPYLGFAGTVPLFEEAPDGNLQTAKAKLDLFNSQRFAKLKRRDGYRIFCVGGSTTYGRPYDDETSFCGWLRIFLPIADHTRRWEVINAGGISYASYRVAKVMEELADYEPDLFIVYCGHNEFLEERTYGDIAKKPAIILALAGWLSRTRTYSLIASWARGQDRSEVGHDVLPAEVNAALDQTVGPQTYRRDDELREKILAHFDFNLRRLADIAHAAGAKVVFVTPGSNLRDCSPFKSEHRADLSADEHRQWLARYERGREALDRGNFNESLAEFDAAASIDDRYAHLHFYRGRAAWNLARYEEAAEAFHRARDEDVCPLRALSPMTSLVRRAARDKGASLVDFESLIGEHTKHGVPGEDWFLDHVHPTIEGNRKLALAILDAMIDERLVTPTRDWDHSLVEQATAEKLSGIDRQAHANARRNLAKVLAWAGKFEEASRLAQQAAQDLPDDAHAQAMAGDLLQGEEKFQEAIACYARSLQLAPDYAKAHFGMGVVLSKTGNPSEAVASLQRSIELQPQDHEAHFWLGSTLLDLERHEEAKRELQAAIKLFPDHALAHKNLGLLSARKGDLAQAIRHFEAAVAIEPHNAELCNDLALMLLDAGELSAAENQCDEALRLDPDFPIARLTAGLIQQRQGDWDQAARTFQQLIDDNVEPAAAHFHLATIYFSRSQNQQAASHLRETLRLDPNHSPAAQLLKRLQTTP